MPPIQRPVVLFVLPWPLDEIGGVNQVVTNLAQQMRDAGQFEPVVLTADWDARQPVFGEVHGLRTVHWQVRTYQAAAGIKERLAYMLWERRFRMKFARFCRKHQVCAVNLHYPVGIAFTFERLLKMIGSPAPLLLSFHGTDVSNLAHLPAIEKEAWRGLIGNSKGIVTCSAELAHRIEAALAMPVRYHVIYNGVDANKFIGHARTRLSDRRVILHVGKFDRNKGQDVLIDAFARIAGRFPDTVLHLVGGSGDDLDKLRAQAARRGLADRIRFFANIPHADMPEYFSDATIFAFPSRREAFGLVLLEAGACRLPVVASRVGGIPELVHDEATGLLVAPNDAGALAQALYRLLDEPAFAAQLAARLAERVAADFSWSNTYRCYEQLLFELGTPAQASRVAA